MNLIGLLADRRAFFCDDAYSFFLLISRKFYLSISLFSVCICVFCLNAELYIRPFYDVIISLNIFFSLDSFCFLIRLIMNLKKHCLSLSKYLLTFLTACWSTQRLRPLNRAPVGSLNTVCLRIYNYLSLSFSFIIFSGETFSSRSRAYFELWASASGVSDCNLLIIILYFQIFLL